MVEEKFEFTAKTKKNLFIFMGVGVLLTIIGIISVSMGGGHHELEGDAGHHAFHWYQRVFANLWINNVFFAGLSLVGVLFFAIQYAAQAGWSAGIKRIPLSFGAWIPFAAVLMLVTYFVAGHDIFHWTHHDLYDVDSPGYDSIIAGKGAYFFWPLEAGSFPIFFLGRMVIFFLVWYLLFNKLKQVAYEEDSISGTEKWYQLRKLSAFFIIFFAVSSSMASWDWVMSIDTHWFSTMFGWYNFASWWVSGLALTALIVVLLKDKGYLKIVNSNHIHDLGKFMFAFSIFWTYIWFSQFLLIYYANIPEETIYFVERWKNGHYAPLFYLNLIINFFFPFLVLMTRDAKRHARFIKVIAPMIIVGHWLDFYLMITPGTLKSNGGFGALELGLMFIYSGAFIFVVLKQMAKAPLFAKNHPMLEESLHHHI
ncbi:quinol:cytochrome C oxidoreductase [Marinoscillum furvescens]|uniref:Quinol:cytochrome c oxidoreductase quinone-binding subunit 2 n=1 Tax=Marinoscillum furvescens DSM 4134 TaxID=1122208 RepID=A0A3D9L122_MARFU|nr:quinol:cytochrome C oxidoreductase [Marinoscillum furvescens]RED96231.1 quinol:cytochrome c oxidoreductase quinone-binding subunit 2 [Marinoscillum furvescens DSM 4134]